MASSSNTTKISVSAILKRLCEEYPILNYEKALELFVNEGYCKAEDDKKSKKKAKKKDPSAPKRPKNPYMFYLADTRATVKEELATEGSVTNVTIEVSKRWNALDDKDKAKYLTMAEEDKKRYETEMKSYVPASDEVVE
jgi:hypothetical protein